MKKEDVFKHMSEISGIDVSEIRKQEAVQLEYTPLCACLSTETEQLWYSEDIKEKYEKTCNFLKGVLPGGQLIKRVTLTVEPETNPTVGIDIIIDPA